MKERGNLIVLPTSGLANRLRVISSAVKLSREGNKTLTIYWQSNQYLNAEFEDIFELPQGLNIAKPPSKYLIWLRLKSFGGKLTRLANWYLDLFAFDFVFFDDMAELVWHNKLDLPQKVKQSDNVFMCTCQELNYFDLADYRIYQPKYAIREKINSITGRFSEHTVGIHIRATDNALAKEQSPYQLFVEKIAAEIDRNPAISFFLSTDEETYQTALTEKFGDRIIYNPKVFGRDNAQGIVDAVTDLFCLSKTTIIYGSFFSSFSYVAGRIGEIDVEVIKK